MGMVGAHVIWCCCAWCCMLHSGSAAACFAVVEKPMAIMHEIHAEILVPVGDTRASPL